MNKYAKMPPVGIRKHNLDIGWSCRVLPTLPTGTWRDNVDVAQVFRKTVTTYSYSSYTRTTYIQKIIALQAFLSSSPTWSTKLHLLT